MRSIVVPAVNTRSVVVARQHLALAERMGTAAQIDCADGRFVRHRTLGPAALARLNSPLNLELHLMVEAPDRWLEAATALHAKRIAFHIEPLRDPRPFIAALRVHRMVAVAALNPTTPPNRLLPILPHLGGVLLLGVTPGPTGGRFHPNVLKRAAQLHRRHPKLSISIDGGLSARTIRAAVRAGATRLVIGSRIFDTADPVTAYRTLVGVARA